MIEKKKLALVIELNGKMHKKALTAWSQLSEKLNINSISSHSPCPHIELASGFESIKLNELYESLDNWFNEFHPFDMYSRGLGVFVANTPVVHIRWYVDKNLIKLWKNLTNLLEKMNSEGLIINYKKDLNWQPKTTLAFNDSSYNKLSEILEITRNIEFNDPMEIKSFSLYEYTKNGGEKNIKNFL